MTVATIEINLPDSFEALHEVLQGCANCIFATPVNPALNKILAWTRQGDEVGISDWLSATLVDKDIQGLTFWTPDGVDVFSSWRFVNDGWILCFSESRGAYICLEKIFGYLVRTVAGRYKHLFHDGDSIINFTFA